MTEWTYRRWQCYGTLVLMILFAVPHAVHTWQTHGQGLLLMRSTDDGLYQAKIRAALLHRLGEVTNGMTGGTAHGLAARGIAPALLEFAVGTAFSWTRLRAPHVITFLTIFLTPLCLPLLTSFLRRLTESRAMAVSGAWLYIVAFASPLQKPVHMSLSLPYTILVLWFLQELWLHDRDALDGRPRLEHIRHAQCGRWLPAGSMAWMIVRTGVLLGLSTGVYFWCWTYLWAVYGMLMTAALLALERKTRNATLRHFLLVGIIGIVVALPTLSQSFGHSADPIFLQTALRSTLIHSRGFESWPRNLLLAILTISTLCFVRQSGQRTHWLFPLAMLLAAFVVMFQNVVHGVILTFASHYYPFVCLAALGVGACALAHRNPSRWRYALAALASIFLLAAVWDYRQFTPHVLRGDYYLREMDHLLPAVQYLDDGRRQVILTDRTTAFAVTGWTDDDVVFTAYVKHLLVSDQEYAERFCLTEIFAPAGPNTDWLAHETIEWPDAAQLRHRIDQFTATCRDVRRDPVKALQQYRVDLLLWNEAMHPDWIIDRRLFEKVRQGEGWSIWKRGEGVTGRKEG